MIWILKTDMRNNKKKMIICYLSAGLSHSKASEANTQNLQIPYPNTHEANTQNLQIPSPSTHVRFLIHYEKALDEFEEKEYYIKKSDIEKDQKTHHHQYLTNAIKTAELIREREVQQEAEDSSFKDEYATLSPDILISPQAFEQMAYYLKNGTIGRQTLSPTLYNELIDVAHYFELSQL